MKRYLNIIHRELCRWRQRPIYLLGSVGVMLAASLFFLTFFSEGLPKDIPVGVVDLDNSSTSRNFRQQLDATQPAKVIEFGTISQARREMETGRISAYVVIPENFDSDVQSFRCPQMGVYVNAMQPIIGGVLAYKDILLMVNLTNGAVQRQVLRAKGMSENEIMATIQPIVLDTHNIGNPTSNYAYYLCSMLLMGILAICIMAITVYSLASEMKYGTSTELMEESGGSILTAVAGKMTPYTILFSTIGISLLLFLFGPLHYPLAGSIWGLVCGAVLMVLAYQALGIFLVSLIPNLRLSVCISSLFNILGITFAGFTLPGCALPAALQGVPAIYPLHYYFGIHLSETLFGAGFGIWWTKALALTVFLFLPFLTMKRLADAYVNREYPID